jgi:hypothetical protein
MVAVYRTIVESNNVVNVIHKEQTSWPRLEEVFEGMKWRLARKPESGTKLAGYEGYYLLVNNDSIEVVGLPRVVLLYTYNDDEVLIENVRVVAGKNSVQKN